MRQKDRETEEERARKEGEKGERERGKERGGEKDLSVTVSFVAAVALTRVHVPVFPEGQIRERNTHRDRGGKVH